jgi:hypothetical protein
MQRALAMCATVRVAPGPLNQQARHGLQLQQPQLQQQQQPLQQNSNNSSGNNNSSTTNLAKDVDGLLSVRFDTVPLDWSLKTKARFTSPSSFAWYAVACMIIIIIIIYMYVYVCTCVSVRVCVCVCVCMCMLTSKQTKQTTTQNKTTPKNLFT